MELNIQSVAEDWIIRVKVIRREYAAQRWLLPRRNLVRYLILLLLKQLYLLLGLGYPHLEK